MSKKIIIIGGGIAGISASLQLARNGMDCTLIEKKRFLGGRAYSNKNISTGDLIDNGQHAAAGAYSEYFKLLKMLETDSNYTGRELRVPFIDEQGRKTVLDTSILPGSAGMALGMLKLGGLSITSKLNFIRFLSNVRNNKIKPDGQSAYDLLIKNKQSGDILEKFWHPVILSACNAKPHNTDAGIFIEMLRRAFFGSKENARLMFSKVPLSKLLEKFEEKFNLRNGKLLYSSGVEQIIIENGKAVGVKLKTGEEIKADKVVAAVPPKSLSSLLPQLIIDNHFGYLSQFEYSPIVSIFFWTDREITDEIFVALLGRKLQWLFALNKIHKEPRSSEFPYLYSATISAANDLINIPDETIKAICIKDLSEIFDKIADAKILNIKIIKEKFATILINPRAARLRPNAETGIKNLFLAGDWTATGLPATMESAALSGTLAANAVLKSF